MRSIKYWSLCVLCGIALIFSLYKLGDQSLWIDEGYSINAAEGIQEHGLPVLGSGKTYVKGIASTYLMALSMSMFGFEATNPWSARLPSAMFWLMTIVAMYFVSKRFFGSNTIAFLSSAMLTFLSWEIAWARQARGYIGMQFFSLVSFFFLYMWFKERKHKSLYLCFIFLGVSILFHPSSAVLILPMTGSVIFDVLKRREERVGPAVLAVAVLLITAIFFYEFLSIQFVIRYSPSYFIAIKENILGLSILALAAPFLLAVDTINKKKIFLLALLVLIPICFLSFYHYSTQQRYLFVLLPYIVLLSAFAAVRISKIVFRGRAGLVILGAIILVSVISFDSFTFYPHAFYYVEKRSPQPNFKEAYLLIKERRTGEDIVVSSYTHLSQIYLRDKGYWWPIALTTNKDEIIRNSIDEVDYYTGAPKINGIDELKLLLDKNSGYIVFDGLSWIRSGKKVAELIRSLKLELVYHTGIKLDEIWVYRFVKK